MLNTPLVSVIVIFLNEEKFIQDAIESVFAQTYNNWELLLIDDGSSDAGTQIALGYAELHSEKVRYLEHAGHQNCGMSASRNLGISYARGEYIGFLDSDDCWLPHKLEQQVEILNSHAEAGMVYGPAQYWYSWTGKPEDAQRDFVEELGVQSDTLFEPPTLLTLLYPLGIGTTPSSSSMLLRREVIERVGAFEEVFRGIYEDQAFLVKVYLNEAVFVASEPWDRYRQHPDSCSAVMERTGSYYSIRLFFLSWLEDYLSERGVKDPEVWQLLLENQRFVKLQIHMQKHQWKQFIQGLVKLLRYHPRRFTLECQKLVMRVYQNQRLALWRLRRLPHLLRDLARQLPS
jgi:glycosyltransferase involved in cell wall biosynthesis